MIRTLFTAAAAVAATCALAVPAAAQVKGPVTASSPDGTVSVTVGFEGEGRPVYSVSRKGKPVLAQSRLGFLFTDAPKIDRRLEITGQETSDFDQTWQQPWGEWASIRTHYRELKVHLRETTALARVFTVTFRIYDDGVGFRYEFPDQPGKARTNIAEELTEFAFAQDGTAWWKPAFLWNREEYLYNRTRVEEVGDAQTPMTVRTDNGLHIAFHEAALVDYSAMWLRKVEGQKLCANLSPSSSGGRAARGTVSVVPRSASAAFRSVTSAKPIASQVSNGPSSQL